MNWDAERVAWEREWDKAFAAATTQRQKHELITRCPRWTTEELRAFVARCEAAV